MVRRKKTVFDLGRDLQADLAAANKRADEATEALNRANAATTREESAKILAHQEIAQLTRRLAAQERELAVLREYMSASMRLQEDDGEGDYGKLLVEYSRTLDAYRALKGAGDD